MITAWKRLCLAGAIALVLRPAATFAQARSRYQWKTPTVSGIRTIGGDFSTSSSGMGNLTQPGAGAPEGILKSSITSNYNISRSAAGKGALKTSLPKYAGLKGQTYGSTKIKLPVMMDEPGRPRDYTAGIEYTTTAPSVQSDLLSKREPTTTSSTTKPEESKPISSFVPDEPSRYQKYMQQGEQAFRAERYIEAADAFEVAIAIGRYLPESHISLVHAYSAMGRYHSAAYQLRQSLKHFPELPLVSLRVRLFYGQTETFVGQIDKLQLEAQKPYAEADLSLLLAYFKYFDGAETDAAKILRRAWDAGKDDPETAEAVETFWNGMVEAGKAEGDLSPTTKPAGQDLPADSKHAVMLPTVSRQPTTAPADHDTGNHAAEKMNARENGQDRSQP